MLPLQITLEGFLSYREPTTISFEGAPLWMLAGANGAGKSSVFDAMRWTLFGAHRGGKSGNEALIHHGQPRLRVAFDLALGESRFRLIRTLARAGRATWQIEEVFGSDTPGDTLKVPETDSREGYEKWVRERIGLSDETFCTAMYLAQNRGDAILGASPQQRYEMLAEIVDISAYAALHERAKTRASELEIVSKAAERSWQAAPDAEPDAIREIGEEVGVLGARIERNRARREQLLGLEPLCAQWQGWENEREKSQIALEQARHWLGDATQIERDFARARELETLLPPLERLAQTSARAAQNAAEIGSLNLALLSSRAQLQTLQGDAERLQAELQALENARQSHETARSAALDESVRLAPRLALARQIVAFGSEVAALQAQSGAFPAGLMPRKTGLEDRLARAQQTLAARAILVRFAREKAVFHDARSRETAARSAIETLRAALPQLEAEVETRRFELETAREKQTRAVEALAAAQTRARDAQQARARFESVPEGSDCFFCGQKLTPEHRQKERARLALSAELTKSKKDLAQTALEAASEHQKSAQLALEAGQVAARKAATALENAVRDAEQAQGAAVNAANRAAEVLSELPASWQARFAGAARESGESLGEKLAPASVEGSGKGLSEDDSAPARLKRALDSDFPAPADLETPADEAKTLRDWRLELTRMTQLESERREVVSRLRDRENQLASGLEALQGEDVEALFARESALKTGLDAATRGLEVNRAPLLGVRQAETGVAREIEAARGDISGAELKLAGLEAARTEIARALSASKSEVLLPFEALDEAELRVRLGALRDESAALGRGDLAARVAALRAAQTRAQELEGEVAALVRALQSVPPEARRAPRELQNEAANLKVALENDGEAQGGLQLEFKGLEERRDEKARLETALFEAQNRAREQRTLADLLGPHELQRFLLREAELGLIDEANAVLDRISGGDLRLELRADDEDIAGARKGVPKVLDVAIFRGDELESRGSGERGTGERGTGERGTGERGTGERGTGERGSGMLPAFLSGSQRFRVAVSLALGIGRFATRGGGSRLEAVIIDEGFGALDKIGRGEMIEELQALGQELKRVILVSHQEEFFEAFPNRYWIEKRGGASKAQLMAG